MIVEQEHPTAGKLRVVGVPVKLSDDARRGTHARAAARRAHDEIITRSVMEIKFESLKRAAVI